jgi:hypothetical protein
MMMSMKGTVEGNALIFRLEPNARYRVLNTGGLSGVEMGDEFAVTAAGSRVKKTEFPRTP